MEAVAKLNNCPLSPRKMRLVVDPIRGKQIQLALNILKFSQRPYYALYVEKLLKSAINNWEQKNIGRKAEDSSLFVKTVMVDGGRAMKRLRTAPQGRGYRMVKRSNHITLIVDSFTDVNQSVSTENIVTQ